MSAAAKGNLGLAAGNLIGGIAVQTMVLVICDAVASRKQALTYLVGSLMPVLEGLLVIFVVCGVLMGALLPESTRIGPVSPASLAIARRLVRRHLRAQRGPQVAALVGRDARQQAGPHRTGGSRIRRRSRCR